MGKVKGEVSNQSDEFYGKKIILDAFISSYNSKDNIIGYHVGDDCDSLCLTACSNNIKIECPCEIEPDMIKVWGNAELTRILNQKRTVINVNFELLIWDDKTGKTGKNGFQMIIESCENQTLIHDSGFVESCPCGKGLKFYCSAR